MKLTYFFDFFIPNWFFNKMMTYIIYYFLNILQQINTVYVKILLKNYILFKFSTYFPVFWPICRTYFNQ